MSKRGEGGGEAGMSQRNVKSYTKKNEYHDSFQKKTINKLAPY